MNSDTHLIYEMYTAGGVNNRCEKAWLELVRKHFKNGAVDYKDIIKVLTIYNLYPDHIDDVIKSFNTTAQSSIYSMEQFTVDLVQKVKTIKQFKPEDLNSACDTLDI